MATNYVDYKRVKLTNHASAQCSIRLYNNGDICLQSYNTDVVYYDFMQGMLYCTGTYSQTTRTHISWFLHEYFPQFSYQELRKAYETDCKLSEVLRNQFIPLTKTEKELMHYAHNGATLNPNCFTTIL